MIQLNELEVNGGKVSCKLSVPHSLKHFFKSNTFIVEYDESVESVPDSILVIPAVMSLAPIAWASNVELFTPPLDEVFHDALGAIRDGYAKMYPSLFGNDGSVVVCDRTIHNSFANHSTPAVLFSGGIDSVAAVLTLLEKSPALFTVHGSDIAMSNHQAWENVYRQVIEFAKSYALPIHSIKSNFYNVLRYLFVDYKYEHDLGRGWWGAVQYGTAFPALCAPIAYLHGYPKVFLGSAGEGNLAYPDAQPIFVNELKWSGTEAFLADATVRRQDKIARIAKYVRNSHELVIRSCLSSAEGFNCSECHKCRRTIVGLILEDIDPNAVGFSVDKDTLSEIRRDFESGSIYLSGADILFWRDFQQRIDSKKDYLWDNKKFFNWLAHINIEDYSIPKLSLRLKIVDQILSIPYPFNSLIYDQLRFIQGLLPLKLVDQLRVYLDDGKSLKKNALKM
ncbi:MAG: hypothetical protein ACOWW1_09980 [archaeon]